MKVVFINGPVGSGRTTVWNLMRTEVPAKYHGQMKFFYSDEQGILTLPDTKVEAVAFITDASDPIPVADAIEMMGIENCLLLRLHRNGTQYHEGDSGYLQLPCMTRDVYNFGDKDYLRTQVMAAMQDAFEIW